MNVKAIVGSVFLGLTLPTFALANVPTPSSLSSLNQEQFNTSETIEIAQRYLSYNYVSGRLQNSESQILGIAREYSQGQPVRWDNISVESLNYQQIKLNVHGKIKRKRKDGSIRVGLFLKRNSQGDFRFVNYDWSTSRCRKPCQKRVEKALRNLPSYFPRFQQVLNRILA